MSTDDFQLDLQRSNPALDFLSGIRQAKAAGKSLSSMVMDIIKLRRGMGKLQPEEYFMYGLYDDERFSPEAKQSFLGQNNLLLPSSWADIARDKPILTAMLKGLGLPTPETQAIVHPTRIFPGAVPLRNREDILRFLRNDAIYPLFGKPFDSVCSMGTIKITGYDKSSDVAIVGEDTRVPLDKIARLVDDFGSGYLFQTLMLPHDSIAELIGPCVSSVRMFVMSDDDGVSLFRAVWKIPASANSADNFWRDGNILAGVDIETGALGRTLVRTESGTEAIEKHPTTGKSFAEMTFPHWDQMRDTVLKAATQIPTCHFQGWDVAMTDRGPVLVELEGDGGNPIMEQLCFETGLLTERYLRIVETAKRREKEGLSQTRDQDRQAFLKSISALASSPPTGKKSEPSPQAEESAPAEKSVPAPVATSAGASVSSTNTTV